MTRILTLAAIFAAVAAGAPSPAEAQSSRRLVVVNGNTGRVVYDDGRNDMFCVYRRRVVGYTWDGRYVVRSRMRCR